MKSFIPYMVLLAALLLEVVATSILKASEGCRNLLMGGGAYALYGLSIYLFSRAICKINLAVADTIWQGLGIVLITLVSFCFFHEPLNAKQIFFMVLTMIGVIGIGLC